MNQSHVEAHRHARVDVADALRGFAVLAIILLHSIEHFNFYSFPPTEGRPEWLAFTDNAVWDSLFFMFGGKAYAIFALLFGFSFFIQHDNHRLRGGDFRGRFCWRLFILFMIGNINAAFFTGEVLVLYSLVGFVLPLVCRLSTRALLWIAAVCVLQPVAVYQIVRSLLSADYEIMTINSAPLWDATFAEQSQGTFWSTVKVNLWEGQLASLAWAWENGRVFQTAGLFIIGMLAGRQGWLLPSAKRGWCRVLAIALMAFFPLHGLEPMIKTFVTNPNTATPLVILVSSLAKLSFMFVLVSGIILGFYGSQRVGRMLSRLIPYGKMSMTAYVTQGIIGSAIFYHWGLYARMGITASAFVGIAIFLVQYVACRWWVGRYGRGPLESLWRSATWLWQR